MGEKTGISWCNHTFNPWWGCTKVSAGCDHCYAEGFDKRIGGDHWGKDKPRRVFPDKHWNEPLKWNKLATDSGAKALVFCASMADIMDDEAPEGALERLWALIDATPHLIWQLLTKRPQRYAKRLPESFKWGNVWLGCSAENQECFDLRYPIVCDVALKHNAIAWVSYEPALGPLSITGGHHPDWIICGGESGGGRRNMPVEWAENLLAECRQYDVAFFMKQMSAITAPAGKLLVPEHLKIHEFPN